MLRQIYLNIAQTFTRKVRFWLQAKGCRETNFWKVEIGIWEPKIHKVDLWIEVLLDTRQSGPLSVSLPSSSPALPWQCHLLQFLPSFKYHSYFAAAIFSYLPGQVCHVRVNHDWPQAWYQSFLLEGVNKLKMSTNWSLTWLLLFIYSVQPTALWYSY